MVLLWKRNSSVRVRASTCFSRLQEAVRSSELPNLFEVLKKLTMSATLLDGVTQISNCERKAW